LKSKLNNAHIIDTSTLPKDQVGFGATVKVKDPWGDEEEYTLVGAGDEDYEVGRILSSSPFGTALVGKKVGDKVEIQAPRGNLKFEILSIEFKD
ncbi:MAG TPA: GreA/GreB family elongation factor, partial [Pirellula sp.]|nr:GreA/GreB family elongation factor [Pirellula sp.]